jgi:hypothetical protein
MTKEQVIALAQHCGLLDPMVFYAAYERFANLVAAAEREWVGLTDDEILEAAQIDGADTWLFATAYAIEAKLKERNT